MATASIEVSGPNVERLAADLQAALVDREQLGIALERRIHRGIDGNK